MRKIIITTILLILLVPFSTKATDGNIEYNIKEIGLKMNLDENLIDLVSNLKNDTQVVQNINDKEKYLERYESAGVLLDAIDNLTETPTREVIISVLTNATYASSLNLNEFSDDDLNSFKTQLLEAIENQNVSEKNTENQYNVIENELIKTKNGNVYINVITKIENENLKADVSIYYTIMNGRFITISFRYYEPKDETTEKIAVKNDVEQSVIENIEFYDVQRPTIEVSESFKLAIIIAISFIVVLCIFIIIIRIKDRRLLNKSIKDIKYKQYNKFGGLMIFFWSLCFYQILLRVNDISNIYGIENMQFYKNILIFQNTALALIAIYQIYITLKRKDDTPKKIIRTNNLYMAIGFTLTLIRIIYAIMNKSQQYSSWYYEQEISLLIFSIIYPAFWNIYFTFSERVRTYYYMPKKKYKEIFYDTKTYKFFKNKLKVIGNGKKGKENKK